MLFTAILGLSTTQIVLRNFFASGLFWADELVRLLVLWLAVAGALAATRDRRHIAIELIDGCTLREKLQRCTIESAEAVDLVANLANALAYAHEKQIVHRGNRSVDFEYKFILRS